jgi:N-methylhydantoinase A
MNGTEQPSRYALSIDIGGTFTDLVLHDATSGRLVSTKVLTTQDAPARAVLSALDVMTAQEDIDAAAIGRVIHATTLFTNALIERNGAKTALITTEGFRDVLEIGRERKYELYDIHIKKPEPLVARSHRLEVAERIDAEGAIRLELEVASLDALAEELLADGIQSVAVVFLHSYANPVHENQAAAHLAERFPALAVSSSIDVAPEIREFERTSTTVANAYIKPLAKDYLGQLGDGLADRGIGAALHLMLSNGGLAAAEEAKRVPVRLLESGPAAGALAAAWFGRDDGDDRLLAFDMGGTTAKLSLVEDGAPLITYNFEAARAKRFVEGSGLPIRISTIELIEIGAGGGSIADVDAIGLNKVGPASAGSDPGPAAYGLGGTAPTVTDANLVLGYLNPDFFAGGSMAIDMEAANTALAALGRRAGLSVEALAWGIHDIVNENMAGAARVHIAERGRDPRGFSVLATGGGGPLHAYHLARKLGLKRLIVPPAAGVASAVGLLIAPASADRVATVAERLDRLDWPAFEARFQALQADAGAVIAETGADPVTAQVTRRADIRYVGQAFELVVDLPPGPYDTTSAASLIAAFEAAYEQAFTRRPPTSAVEIINIRISLSAEIATADPHTAAPTAGGLADALKHRRPVYFAETDGYVETPVYDRYRLRPGDGMAGPAIIEERESTLVLGPAARATVAANANILVEIGLVEDDSGDSP